jgi:DNA-binding transcriptional ArsR family regulator
VHAFDVLGDPVRRRVLELLVDGERTAGDITETIVSELAISQPAVSQHLKVLRESGFVQVRVDGARRYYALEAAPLIGIDKWLAPFRSFWDQRLDALGTELKRGQRARRAGTPPKPSAAR